MLSLTPISSFFTLYLTKQIIHTGIDNCRSYPRFQNAFEKYENCLIAGQLFFYIYSMIKLEKNNTPLIHRKINDFKWYIIPFCGGCLATMGVNSLYNKCMQEDPESLKEMLSDHQKEDLTLNWEKPLNERVSQALTCAEMITLLSHAYFSNVSKVHLVLISMQLYSFHEITRTPWLKFERKLENKGYQVERSDVINQALQRVDHFVFSYYFLMLPRPIPPENQSCTVCLEDKPDTYQCVDHLFHKKCLVAHMHAKMENVLAGFTVSVEISGGTVKKMQFTLKEEKLPSCANCRKLPLHYEYQILTSGI